jgi:hypothetical protein
MFVIMPWSTGVDINRDVCVNELINLHMYGCYYAFQVLGDNDIAYAQLEDLVEPKSVLCAHKHVRYATI